jgi:hypothetical protein
MATTNKNEVWNPIRNMPSALVAASVAFCDGVLNVVLCPEATEVGTKLPPNLKVCFHTPLAHAVYDDMVFSLSDIHGGFVGGVACIVKGSDWPVKHELLEKTGYKNVTHYRFFTSDSIVDVLAAGQVEVAWSEEHPLKSTNS